MESSRKNRALDIFPESASILRLLKEGLFQPFTSLMSPEIAKEVAEKKLYKNTTLPFPFLLTPGGEKNEKVIEDSNIGDIIDLRVKGEFFGRITLESIQEIDKKERLRQIYGSDDISHPGVRNTYNNIGKYAIGGEYVIETLKLKEHKEAITSAKERIGAKDITAIMIAANPLHRVHERLITLALEKSDLIVLFLLKPFYNQDGLDYDIRYKSLDYFVKNHLPKNRAIIVPIETPYSYAGYNELILDALIAKNYGCNRMLIGQHHAGMGTYYDHNIGHSVIDTFKGIDIEIETTPEYFYCNKCRMLVSTKTCPHGQHHHISYHSESILELIKQGIMPPAVLMRKEISAIVISELFKDRFKNLEKLYYDILPINGLLEEHSEKEFYIELMKLYQTTALN